MGKKNKNVKKTAVSNAVVKKKPMGTGAKSTGGTRPGMELRAPAVHVQVTEQRVPAVHIQIKRAAGQKIAQPEAMEAAQKTAAYVQTIHQEERHSHKKEDAGE